MRPEHPDANLVSVFKTDDQGLLPLAVLTLESAGIEHFVKSEGKFDSLQWVMSQPPTNRPVVLEILVADDMAFRARDLLADLEHTAGAAIASASPADPALADPPAITVENARSGAPLGALTEAQLQDLVSRLEPEAPQQYFVDGATLDMLEQAHADPALIDLLRQAIGDAGDGLAIRWLVR